MIFYIYAIFYKADFAYYDEDAFLLFKMLSGADFPTNITPRTGGRFYPLAGAEFNIINDFVNTPKGYHAYPVLQLIIFILGLFWFLRDFQIWFRLSTIMLIVTNPSFVISFFGLVYPERNLIFWIFIFLLSFQSFTQKKSPWFFAGTLISAQIILYTKEPIFLMIGTFATSRLIIEFYRQQVSYNFTQILKFLRNHFPEISLLFLAGIFALIYFTIYPIFSANSTESSYASTRAIGYLEVLSNYFYTDLLLIVFLLAIVIRAAYLIKYKKYPDSFYDPLALAAVVYFLVFLKLQIFSRYYMAPVNLIAILYLSRFVYSWIQGKRFSRVLALFLIFIFIFLRNASYSFFHVVERKNLITAKVRLYQFLKDYQKETQSQKIYLFFPYAHRFFKVNPLWTVGELTTFLEYKGLNIRGNLGMENEGVEFIVKLPTHSVNNQPMAYGEPRFYYGERPESGDIVIVLPDDDVSRQEINQMKQEAELLWHYEHQLFPLAKNLISIFMMDKVVFMPYKASGIYVFRWP
ncbi:MAG: hypothetical protein EWV89_05185 [Microcystis wesenbergii Mw_QC_B_20070930_S4]|jgi:hypothetical protein|nr:MAG: hypothetical protein EWV73_00235 [Microcystis wesenbergii Mw_QC_B_20070930_S4D]TRV16416.1 MAG: hypothetical protein EWV89_05185 [Microcystis wesenbergii Mw_QC_B_20070930_S4]